MNRNGATSETPGALSTEKGAGRQTASAEKPDARREQAVEHAFAHSGRDARGDPVADQLLQQAVADRHAAGDGDMGADRARQLDEAEEAGPTTVDFGDPPLTRHAIWATTNRTSSTARGLIAVTSDTRLAAVCDFALRLVVERSQQRPLGDVDEIASVDDRAHRILDLSSCMRRIRPVAIERYELPHQTARRDAIVGSPRLGEGDMHFGDPGLARDRDHLARRNADEADQEHEAEHKAEIIPSNSALANRLSMRFGHPQSERK